MPPTLRLPLLFLLLSLASPAWAGGADLFSSATALTGLASDTGDNLTASSEDGEPTHGVGGPAASVWWRWTAASNGLYSITTLGSSFDTVLGVYTGGAVDALTLIAGNDDSPGEDTTSRVMLEANAGASYSIAVDGYGGDTGTISLRVEAAPNTRMAGMVRDGSSSPLANIEVVAWKRVVLPDGERWDRTASVVTGPDGTYAVLGLPPGTYVLYFFDPTLSRAGQFLGGAQELGDANIQWVNLRLAEPLTGLDATLAPGATISGRVTLADGTPLANVDVDVADANGAVRFELRAVTDANGQYTLRGLPIGNHYLTFSRDADFLEYWHDAAASLEQAVPVTLAFAGGSVTGIDAELTPGGALGGRVASSVGNNGLEGILVQAISTSGQLVRQVVTDIDGLYLLSQLPVGAYRLHFSDVRDQRYLAQWYADATVPEDAIEIALTGGSSIPGLDVYLIEASSLAGRVTAANGVTGVSNILVEATFASTGFPAGTANTSSDGTYIIPNLEAGDYLLRFSDPFGRYLAEWHANATQMEQALEIPVGEGEHLTGINASLAPVPTVTPPRILSHRIIGNGQFALTWVAQANSGYHVLRADSPTAPYQLAPIGSEPNQQAVIPAGAQRFVEYADPVPGGAPGHVYKVEWVPTPVSAPVP